MSVSREDRGALSGTGLHHHHPKVGSTGQHLRREAHKIELACHQRTAETPMGQIIVVAPEQGAKAPRKTLKQTGQLRALPKKMATAAALAPAPAAAAALFPGKGAQLRMVIMVPLESSSQRNNCCWTLYYLT